MPLLKRKPCFGRPERWLRGMLETKSYRQSADTIGYSRTRCDQCQLKSPDTFAACASLATERIDTAPAIKRAVDEWADTAEHRKDDRDPDPYKDAFGGRWERVLRVIRQHNGWTNTNDDVAAGAERAKQDEAKDRKNGSRREARREHRERFKDAMVNAPSFRLALNSDAAYRRKCLDDARRANGAERWLAKLPDESCAFIMDVWKEREVLLALGEKPTAKAIATRLAGESDKTFATLTRRVGEAIKRIGKLEDAPDKGVPIWTNRRRAGG